MPVLHLRTMRKADLGWVAQAERQLFSAEAWSPQLLASELDAMHSLDDRIYVVERLTPLWLVTPGCGWAIALTC